MSELALRVSSLGKRYHLGRQKAAADRTLRETMAAALRAPFTRSNKGAEFWALKDVSFDVPRGAVLGVIGRNGAGKSTLLKILARVTEPTTGRAEMRGRVGSLLEVGTGFHPELTGRENIYLNGAILGMKRSAIAQRFDEIVAFAEVAEFIDTPVKRYSSGMYLRLAFAVAAHLEPDILLVDEVLAVGDLAFQRKCLGKMREVSSGGRTVLFVSHNLSAIGRLCSQAIYIDRGQLAAAGETAAVMSRYLASAGTEVGERDWPDDETAPGDENLRLLALRLLAADGSPAEVVRQDRAFQVAIRYRVLASMANANVGLELRTEEGVTVLATYDADDPAWSGRGREPGVYESICTVPARLLNEGTYVLKVSAGIPHLKLCISEEDVLSLEVAPPVSGEGASGRMGARRPGIVAPDLPWTVEALGS